MSEYQYYDFRSLDKPLTAQQQASISNLSSRAMISSRHAQFVYHYGDFHGDTKQLMAEHFDMMLYVANWGTQQLMFRIPETLINISLLKDYFISDELEHYRANKNIILDLNFNDEEGGGYWIEGEGMLDDLLPLREEIIQGDYRVLYLAWLKAAENAMHYDEGINEQTREPKVPAGLDNLSQAQKEYVKWIELDESLIAVAARNSERASKGFFQSQDYLHNLSIEEKDDFLKRLCKNESNLSATLNRHIETIYKSNLNQLDDVNENNQRRTFFELYGQYEQRRKQVEEELSKAEAIRDEKLRIEAKRKHQVKLDKLLGNENILWKTIDTLVQQGNAKSYDLAADHLSDLNDLAKREDKLVGFMRKTVELTKKYSRRIAFIRRVKLIVDL